MFGFGICISAGSAGKRVERQIIHEAAIDRQTEAVHYLSDTLRCITIDEY